MRAAGCDTRPSHITSDAYFIDCQFQIGEWRAEADNGPLDSFYIRGYETGLMLDETRRKECSQSSQITLVESLFN